MPTFNIDRADMAVGTLNTRVFIKIDGPENSDVGTITLNFLPHQARNLARELVRNADLLDSTGKAEK